MKCFLFSLKKKNVVAFFFVPNKRKTKILYCDLYKLFILYYTKVNTFLRTTYYIKNSFFVLETFLLCTLYVYKLFCISLFCICMSKYLFSYKKICILFIFIFSAERNPETTIIFFCVEKISIKSSFLFAWKKCIYFIFVAEKISKLTYINFQGGTKHSFTMCRQQLCSYTVAILVFIIQYPI